mmetsp:Transcript_14513/g.29698  ORF Transcript_14513/g.29698 Transcript_14513/m.29698 type:complete len:87 (-) Transcript_14513:144-404(-)
MLTTLVDKPTGLFVSQNNPTVLRSLSKKLKDGELMILDAKVEDASILEGEEEKKYWDDFIEFKSKQMVQRAEERKRGGYKRHKTRQ